ncbi:unnamed protein product [Cercopithifilaria johnstoni]|uniref:Serpin domain-containing protein n=1 Tax=Cercopithifilaria johnstoni TaxID=2874296 RepID=A0A8J2LM85_9BILA|nr:unnamed protein product [Cercopithifilaria johnstoni]
MMKLTEVILIVGIVLIGTCYCPRSTIPPFCKSNEFKLAMTRMKFDFALNLLRHSSPPDETSLLSPYAIIPTLSILHDGVASKIKRQIKEMIVGLSGLTPPALDRCQRYVMDDFLRSILNGNQYLERSSKLWVQENVTLTKDFTNALINKHGVEIGKAYLSPQNVTYFAQEATAWLRSNPNHEIKNTIFINFGFSMFFISKLHYEIEWKYYFLPLSQQMLFTVSSEKSISVPMMGMGAYFPYYEDDNVQVVSLPFENGELQMAIILPREIHGIQDFEKKLTGELLISYIDALRTSVEIMVLIPKFATKKYFVLSTALENMGLQSMFNRSADLSSISKHELWITNHVVSLASLEINERGITNKSSISGGTIDEYVQNQLTFVAHHPFIYVIFDNQKNIQWIGRYTAKKAKSKQLDEETSEESDDDYMTAESDDDATLEVDDATLEVDDATLEANDATLGPFDEDLCNIDFDNDFCASALFNSAELPNLPNLGDIQDFM